ncbi:MAG TPA: BlaI/MecI/CopY family transcriptional regulator [Dongiaceae bacterium]|nr:BlaI/MecI/CopY family transcriptional regulator [Dongiaceae bacterium]
MSIEFAINGKGGRKRIGRISGAEWVVMKVIWELNAGTAKQVVEALKGRTRWKPKTIHTLLSRLVRKGALASEKSSREYLFKPLVAEEACRISASRSLLESVFDGEIAPFLACFLKSRKLSAKEIEELKRILEAGES